MDVLSQAPKYYSKVNNSIELVDEFFLYVLQDLFSQFVEFMSTGIVLLVPLPYTIVSTFFFYIHIPNVNHFIRAFVTVYPTKSWSVPVLYH